MSHSEPGPATRQDRRRLELEQRREQRRRAREAPPAAPLGSPMVLFTVGALLVGLVIVGFLVLSKPGPPSVADLNPPSAEIPAGVAIEGRSIGNADAKVMIDIWSDFQCPACTSFATRIEPLTISTYVLPGTVKLVYHDAAFQGQGRTYDESTEAAAAARCAADQGLFWQMHDWIYANWNGENQGAFVADRLRAMATGAGLDLVAYDACMAAGDKQAAVRAETLSAVTAGIDQTPTLIINGVAMVGTPRDFATFARVIDQAAAAQ
jgi:protein-disulfide isomerase